ncbi:MAG: hypothetical protein ACQERX_06045, partial [Bacillota bacterium]
HIKNRDGKTDDIHLYYPLFTKHIVYSSEKELRIMYKQIENSDLIKTGRMFQTSINHGIPIKVDLAKIIENITISPYGNSFFKNTVKDVLKVYGFDINVTDSSILIRK